MDRGTRPPALRTATQDHRIAGLQAQRAGVRRHVRTALVDDADDAERHAHALDHQAVGPGPLRSDAAERIRQCGDVLQALCHRLDALVVEFQAIEHRVGQAARTRRVHVLAVGFEDLGTTGPQLCGRAQQGLVALRGAGDGQRFATADGGTPQRLHLFGERRIDG